MESKALIILAIIIIVIILLLPLTKVQAQEEQHQWVELYLKDGSIIKGRLLRQKSGEYVVENEEVKVIVKVDSVEMVKFYSPAAVKRKKEKIKPEKNYFFSLGVSSPKRIVWQRYRGYFVNDWSEGYYRDVFDISSVTGKGIMLKVGFTSPVVVPDKNKHLAIRLVSEVGLSSVSLSMPFNFLGIDSIGNRIITFSLLSKTSYNLSKSLSVYLAAGQVFAREWYTLKEAINPASAHSFMGLVIRGGVELPLNSTTGLNLSFSRYWEQGVKRWDMNVGYVF